MIKGSALESSIEVRHTSTASSMAPPTRKKAAASSCLRTGFGVKSVPRCSVVGSEKSRTNETEATLKRVRGSEMFRFVDRTIAATRVRVRDSAYQ